MERIATLDEVDRSWSLTDMLQAGAVLDYQRDAEALARKGSRDKK
jgi:hypothetical protein